MATLTTNISEAPAALRNWLASIGTALQCGLEAHMNAASRRDKIEALEAKSDEELAQMGLTRDQIIHYVYRDLFYT
ncbi:hypothetical protein SAMN05444398_105185 [Roseovarius pacificus]|uniref:DUF1127 domain-containing protein n=1 Tax=Roseovarius pacificus TaxID=337701 RepID=A0A1M7DAE0_9RHOB|nr:MULTISPECIES: hypothetical protein [Roseovarius]MBU3259373.1 hypothetical protein [Roseovarius sp. PS-C2]MDW3117124.1 hypothetical protein [Roseovarius pacificus]GGO56675.1 hypothetical protein GCM10011315_22070 [Roseovarius pacificus]SHL76481.1 hypothetical protein SAMN05444398_105185 [Roseovarius pacificus]